MKVFAWVVTGLSLVFAIVGSAPIDDLGLKLTLLAGSIVGFLVGGMAWVVVLVRMLLRMAKK
jgi:hypothetical protein